MSFASFPRRTARVPLRLPLSSALGGRTPVGLCPTPRRCLRRLQRPSHRASSSRAPATGLARRPRRPSPRRPNRRASSRRVIGHRHWPSALAIGFGHRLRPSASAICFGHRLRPSASAISFGHRLRPSASATGFDHRLRPPALAPGHDGSLRDSAPPAGHNDSSVFSALSLVTFGAVPCDSAATLSHFSLAAGLNVDSSSPSFN